MYFQKCDITIFWMNFCLETTKKNFLPAKMWFLCFLYAIILWTKQMFLTENWILDFSRFNTSFFQPLERGMDFCFVSKRNTDHGNNFCARKSTEENPVTAAVFPRIAGIHRYFATTNRARCTFLFFRPFLRLFPGKFWQKVALGF